MNYQFSSKQKTIIAREFLYIVTCVLITLIFSFSLYSYNTFLDYKINNQNNIIRQNENEANDLSKLYDVKTSVQENFIRNVYLNLNVEINYNDIPKVWKRLNKLSINDSIYFKWNNQWSNSQINSIKKQGINSPSVLKKFIIKNTILDVDSKNNQKSSEIFRKTNRLKSDLLITKKSKISDTDFRIIIKRVFITLILIFFLLRHSIYATIWSLKTIKSSK